MLRPLCVLLCCAMCSCVPFEPFPRRTGNYADSLHFGDIVEIRALVRNRKDIRHPIGLIDVLAPDRAIVDSGAACEPPGGTISQFTVRKRNGHWTIDESSIQDRSQIIIDEPIGSN